MLTVEVTRVGSAGPPVAMSARFDESGGSIGRDAACTLALPDPEQRISRAHGVVSFRDGRYRLRNQGSALPLLVNDAPLDFGAEIALADGDRLAIGEYAMVVRATPSARRSPAPAALAPQDAGAKDILDDFGPAGAVDPFADLIPHAAAPAPAPAAGAPPTLAEQIPEDFDPFREPPVEHAPAAQPGSRSGDFSDLVPAQTTNVDELFGLRAGAPLPPDSPLAPRSAAATPGPVGIDDLLQPRSGVAAAPPPLSEPAQRDDAPEIESLMQLPAIARAEAQAASPPGAPVSAGGDMKLSWEEGGEEGLFQGERSLVIGRESGEGRRGERRAAPLPQTPAPPAPATPAAGTLDPRLLKALLEGLGLDRWPDGKEIDADAMLRFGRLLRCAVRGTIDLLRARATIKSEVQADMTMIVDTGNNPLKFSPNVEAALVHLLGPVQRGFMPGTDAMDDAYRDLVAHQFGFTAGTRAAIEAMLARFDPAKLQTRLAARSMLDTLLPDHRKAKLWDLFAERYGQIAAEAEDDFDRLFGKAFVRAYEEQVARMTEDGPRKT